MPWELAQEMGVRACSSLWQPFWGPHSRASLAFEGLEPLALTSSPCPCGTDTRCGMQPCVSEGPGQQNPGALPLRDSESQCPFFTVSLPVARWLQGASSAGHSPTPTAPCRALFQSQGDVEKWWQALAAGPALAMQCPE